MDDNSIKETEDGRSTKSVGFKNNPLLFRKNITVAPRPPPEIYFLSTPSKKIKISVEMISIFKDKLDS